MTFTNLTLVRPMLDPYNEACWLPVKLSHNRQGLILALNARVLSKEITAFDAFLERFPFIKILAWTGSGEPNVPASLLYDIESHFRDIGRTDVINFDCLVEP